MSEANESIRRLGAAKAYVDNGLCRVGPRLAAGDLPAGLMAGCASRALALSDAVVKLCRQDAPTESLPALRQLFETAAAMRWLAGPQAGREARAKELEGELNARSWDALWNDERLKSRAASCGMQADLSLLPSAADFSLGSREGAPWSHVFAMNRRKGPAAEAALSSAARLMGHVLKALNDYWPESFPGAEAMWEPY